MARTLPDARILDERLGRLRREAQRAVEQLEAGADPRAVAGRLRKTLDQVPAGRWDRDQCIDAGQRYAAEFGEPPTAASYNPAQARAKGLPHLADRWEAGDYPSYPTVIVYFDTWDAYMLACGFEPRPHLPPASTPGKGGDAWAHLPKWEGWRYLEGLRKRAGYSSQSALAEAAGLTLGYINALENGRQSNPTVRVVLALTRAMHVRPAALLDHVSDD